MPNRSTKNSRCFCKQWAGVWWLAIPFYIYLSLIIEVAEDEMSVRLSRIALNGQMSVQVYISSNTVCFISYSPAKAHYFSICNETKPRWCQVVHLQLVVGIFSTS